MFSKATRNVAVLVAAQAFLGAQVAAIFVIGGLAGQQLSSIACLATLPISMIVFGSMTTAPWLSPYMQRKGRQAGFIVGALGGFAGAAVCVVGLWIESFPVFLAGSYLTGIYMSSQGFFRFAVMDTVSEEFRPKAVSYVMAGGLVSAIIGPQMSGALTVDTPDATVLRFVPVYVAVMGINLAGLILFLFLDIPVLRTNENKGTLRSRSRAELLRDPTILVAIICGMVSYALMNLVMTATPLAVVGCGFGVVDAGNVVTAHVLAMFAPSFFTGHLIARFGVRTITGTGILILMAAGIVALMGTELTNFFSALILLGLGWNFGFIGATTMLASAHRPEERGVVQGMNDMIVFGMVTLASLASGGLMNCSGATATEGWTAVNIAMIPLLCLAGGSLIWLTLRPANRPA